MPKFDNKNSSFYDQLADKICKEIVRYSPQLYYLKNAEADLIPDSTSILLHFNGYYLLVTTGHTFINADLSTIGFFIGNEFIVPAGTLKFFEPNDDPDKYHPEKLDLAIIALEQSTVAKLSTVYSFLDSQKLAGATSNAKYPYIVFGYPAKRTKFYAKEKMVEPIPFVFRTINAPVSKYKEKNIDPSKTLIVEGYQKKVMRSYTGLIEKLPALNGISGCGIWALENFDLTNPQYKLISILTGENKEKTHLYSTKVDFIIKLFT